MTATDMSLFYIVLNIGITALVWYHITHEEVKK